MARCKTPGRKRQKRSPVDRKPVGLDEEMLELAGVIAEYQLDNNADGWFKPPWRNGWNAVELAMACWRLQYVGSKTDFETGIGRYLDIVIQRRILNNETYLQATDDITALTLHGETEGRKPLVAALRCYQILAANSSGGGEVYNDVLKRALAGWEPTEIAALVCDWRCMDAIGAIRSMCSDANDRLRRAFTIAWMRGLYHAAYSLPQAVDFTVKPQLVKE